jgi:tetratricopeptide (TPR) repeat protein
LSRLRKIKILTTGIHRVFRGLKYLFDVDIGKKDLFRFCLLLLLAIVLLINLILFWSRFCYQTGIDHINRRNYDLAFVSFQQARNAIPDILASSLARQDIFRIHTQLGTIFHIRALELWKAKGSSDAIVNLYEQARKNLEAALKIDPNTYIPTYRLARTYTALEVFHAALFPYTLSPYNTGLMYKEAIALRPNGIGVHNSYARYLHYKKDFIELGTIVRNMTRIYPAVYHKLKREPFFSPDLLPEMEKGLLAAVDQGINSINAHSALSAYYNENKAYDKAVEHYKQSFALLKSYAVTSGHYMHLGRLYLRAGNPEKSRSCFMRSIEKSNNFDSTIRRIHSVYKHESSQNQLDQFISFGVELEKKKRFSPALSLEIAKAWMDKKQYSFARARLYQLNSRQADAQAYYLLARIAQAEKDWDQMEINSQKATMLDRKNSTYFHMCAQALQYQKKYESAEEMAGKALEHSQKPNPWLFNHRAWIRWAQKKYIPAISDWKQAFALKPNNSDFPYRIALAYEQKALFREALDYIEQAIALKPDNQGYRKLHNRLEGR